MQKEADKSRREKAEHPHWGDWRLHKEGLALVHQPTVYCFDLEEVTSSAQILDFIFQIRQKRWATPQVMSDLLEAINMILDPQKNYCSLGKDRRCNGTEAVRRFLAEA